MPSSDLTALLLKSDARMNRVQVLNADRAAHALRLNRKQLGDYAVAEGMGIVKDTLGFYWLKGSTSTFVSSIVDAKNAMMNDAITDVVLADGVYDVANATNEAATSLFFGSMYASRTKHVVLRPATPGGVTIRGVGVTCGLFIGVGAKFLTFDGLRFEGFTPVSSGVIVISRHGRGEAGATDIVLKNMTVGSTCLGANASGTFTDHALYLSSGIGGPTRILIEDFTVEPPADRLRLLHSGIHVFGSPPAETNAWGVTVNRARITAKDGLLIWGTDIHDHSYTGVVMADCSTFGVRLQYANPNMSFTDCSSVRTGVQGWYSPAATPDNTAPAGTTWVRCSFT